jgi:hypothetical protein
VMTLGMVRLALETGRADMIPEVISCLKIFL